MASATKVVLILGAGKNIGQGLAQRFKAAGYKIATVARSTADSSGDGTLSISADLAQPSAVPKIFEKVKSTFGNPPTVVVYNAAALTPPEDPQNPFSVPLEKLERDMAIMNSTPYVVAREAVAGFESLGSDVPKAFIYTGNTLAAVTRPVPMMATLGTGKSAASYWLGLASGFYKDKGYKFFFADERKSTGGSVSMQELSGKGAGEFYLELAEGSSEIPWYATFVDGKYVHFPESSKK